MSVSSQTFTKEAAVKLDIIPVFNELMKASIGKDSLYLKVKDTLTFLFEDGNFTTSEKAKITADTIAGLSGAITAAAMEMAFKLTKENRDAPYDLAEQVAKVKLLQEQADKMASDVELTDEQIENIKADTVGKIISGWKLQADVFTKNGMSLTAQSLKNPLLTSNALTNPLALDTVQAEQTKSAVYSTLASSFRKDGVYTWTTNASKDVVSGASAATGWVPLVKAQTDVAIRQEKGFDDNMKQHAANSSANMIGLLLSSENYAVITAADVDRWRTAVNYLNS